MIFNSYSRAGKPRIFAVIIFQIVVRISYGCSIVFHCDYATCTEPNYCITCSPGYGLTFGQQQGVCQLCATRCHNCSINGAGQCDICVSGYGLNTNRTCTACSDMNCASCYDLSSPNGDYCSTCKDGFYFNNTAVSLIRSKDNLCRHCASNCRSCTGPTSNECYSCFDGYSFSSDSQICILGSVPTSPEKTRSVSQQTVGSVPTSPGITQSGSQQTDATNTRIFVGSVPNSPGTTKSGSQQTEPLLIAVIILAAVLGLCLLGYIVILIVKLKNPQLQNSFYERSFPQNNDSPNRHYEYVREANA